MAFSITITNAGRTALVNAANTGTAPVTITQVGLSATAVAPSILDTALPGEFKRVATFSGDVVADDTIHLIVRDETAQVFTLRSFALYLEDGTLFAIYGQAGSILEKSAQAMMLLAIDIQFADVDATALTFGDTNFLNPPATTERQGVVELATLAETIAGVDTLRAPAAKMVKDAVFAWLDARFGANNAGVWHPGNDGAGSGLDADLLDGQDGGYYSNIIARLGYAPVNRTGDIMSGQLITPHVEITTGDLYLSRTSQTWGYIIRPNVAGYRNLQLAAQGGVSLDNLELNGLNVTIRGNIVWHSANDGAGSGMDADLLDGQQGSYYSNITARLGYTPVQQGGGVGQLGNQVKIGWSGTRLKATVDAADQGNFVFDSQIGDVWRASNDGSGSGLDADLLDGLQAAALVKYVDFTKTTTHEILPDGRIIQWGFADALPNRAVSTITFPITFPNAALQMLASLGSSLTLTENRVGCGAAPISQSQGQIAISANAGGTTGVTWIAIGH